MIQMELCECTLKEQLVESSGTLASQPKKLWDFFGQTVAGLLHLHNRGIVHRDLKPSNILMSRDASGSLHAKIGDLGLARRAGNSDDSGGRAPAASSKQRKGRGTAAAAGAASQEGGAAGGLAAYGSGTQGVGTYLYMPPETRQGAAHDTSSDMYALGVVLFEMWHFFGSQMERCTLLEALCVRHELPPAFMQRCRYQSELILWLTHPVPHHRPPVQKLLMELGGMKRVQPAPRTASPGTHSRRLQLSQDSGELAAARASVRGPGRLADTAAAPADDAAVSGGRERERSAAGLGLGIGSQMGLSVRTSGAPAAQRGAEPVGRLSGVSSDVTQASGAAALSTSAPLRPSGLALATMHTHARRTGNGNGNGFGAGAGAGAGARTISGDASTGLGSNIGGAAPGRRFLDDTSMLDDSCSWSQFRAQRLEVTALQDQIRDLQLAHDMARARLREAERTAASLLRDNKALKQDRAQLARENVALKARLRTGGGGDDASGEAQERVSVEQGAASAGAVAARRVSEEGRGRRGSAAQQAKAAAPAPSQVAPRGGTALRNGLLMRVLRPHGAQQSRAGPT